MEEEDEDKEEEEDGSDRRLALFGALLCLNASAAQSAVCVGWSSAFRRAVPGFSLLNAGGWKASYVSLCAWLTNDNALLLFPLRKQRIFPAYRPFGSLQSSP